jgi:predicted dehydrogenase
MKRYKAVVLGAGWRGQGHIRAFLANADRFELSAVCDQNTARMKKTLAELGVSLPVYADADAMLAAERPEVFCFATQPDVRLALVKLGVRHGVRAIAYEKPMAISLAEAREICAVCDRAGVKQIVCHQHKYGGHWQKVRELVRSGQLGRVRQIHATSKGWFYHYVTHLVDYAMWLMDYPGPQWIVGHIHGRTQLKNQHSSPDYVMGQVGFDNGVRAIFECGPLAPSRGVENFWYDAGATVLGSEGFAEVIVGAGWRARTAGASATAQDSSVSLSEIGDTIPYIADLARWLDDDAQVHPCNGALAYRGFEVAMGMLQSGLERRLIVPPVNPAEPVAERVLQELPESAVWPGGPA